MRTPTPLLRASLLALLAACGSPSAPGDPAAAPLSVDRSDVLLEAIGDSAALTATRGAESTRTPSLAVESESRYLGEAEVLDAAALARGVLRAAAPGSATVRVGAFGAAPARVRVEVRPRRPVVLSAVEEGGDTVRLRGFALGGVGAGSAGGVPVRVLGGDSATLRILAPAAECTATPAPRALEFAGADVAAGVGVARRPREVRLAVGEVLSMAGDARCIRLAPEDGARYALAFVDARRLVQARAGWEGSATGPGRYTVTVAEAGSAARAASGISALRVTSPEEGDAVADARLFARARPWTAGERFETADPATGAPIHARVAAVHGSVVLAVAEGHGADERWLAQADTALRFVAGEGWEVLRRALGTGEPVTSGASGQLLVLASRGAAGAQGAAESRMVEGAVRSVVYLDLASRPASAPGLLRVVAHEVAHAWQARYAAETAPADALSGARWSLEGTAELLAWWMLGRFHGIAPDANWDWRRGMDDPALVPYALLAAGTRDSFAEGYASAASYELDVAARMVRGGASWDAALAAVVRGSLDGWYGFAPSGARRTGLVARVRPVLGEGWTPEGSLLTWALSQAVDDVAAAPAFQNPAFLRAHTGPSAVQGWGAPAVLNTGGTATRVNVGAASEVWGNAAAVSPVQGSPGYVLLDDHGRGGTYSLRAESNGLPLAGMEWAILRYR